MTQETINEKFERRIEVQNTKIDMFIEEMRDFKAEMREQNQLRAQEISAINARIDTTLARIDEKFSRIDEKFARIDEKFERILNQIQNMAIVTVVGVGAIVIGVAAYLKP